MAGCTECGTNDDSCEHYAKLRKIRNIFLKQSDAYVLPDLWEAYTDAQKETVRAYRQALRDFPATVDSPLAYATKLPAKPPWVPDSDVWITEN